MLFSQLSYWSVSEICWTKSFDAQQLADGLKGIQLQSSFWDHSAKGKLQSKCKLLLLLHLVLEQIILPLMLLMSRHFLCVHIKIFKTRGCPATFRKDSATWFLYAWLEQSSCIFANNRKRFLFTNPTSKLPEQAISYSHQQDDMIRDMPLYI